VALVPLERVDAVARAVDAAFAAQGFRPPAHLVAEPGAAADLLA
jgi:galactokinase